MQTQIEYLVRTRGMTELAALYNVRHLDTRTRHGESRADRERRCAKM